MPTTVDEIRSTTTIDAPIERVWKAITTPSEIKQWFFGVDTEADWRPGGRLVHIMPKGMRAEEVMMHVQVVHGLRALVDTDLRLQNRGVMLIGLDEDVQAPGILLIMLKAVE